MKTGIPTNGSMVKNHISLKTEFGLFVTPRTSFLLWFQACQVPGSSSTSRTPMKQESHSSSSSSSSSSSPTVISPVPVSNSVDDRLGQPDDETQANETPKTNKKETTIERGNPLCSDDPEIPEWLQEFRENLVDDEIPLQGGSHASSSHEASLEPTTKRREDLGKHSVYTRCPKDRNCEICQRTKITRAPC